MRVVQNNPNATKKGGVSILSNIGSVASIIPKLINIGLVIALIIVGPWLYRYIKAQIQANNEQDAEIDKDKAYESNKDPVVQQSKADKITKSKELQAAAKKIAHDLGTKYSDQNSSWLSPSTWSIFNPKGWTENDEEARNVLLKYRNYYPTLKRLYHDCYSNSRNLSDDLVDLLDKEDLALVRKAIKLT
jgi:hypothetical protein